MVVVVGDCVVVLDCWVTVVVVCGVGFVVLVVLSEKHDVSDRAMIMLQVPMREVVFIDPHYSSTYLLARWGDA